LPDGTVDSGTLATDSVTAVKIPDTVESSLKSGRKNLIINGGFDVWQRGTSFSGVSNGAYTADRWTILDSVGNNITTVTPKTTTDKYTYVEKTSGTGSGGLHQFVEINHLIPSGTNLVISFDGTHLSGTNSYRVVIQYRPNSSWSGVSSEIGTLTFVTSEGLNSLTVTTTEDMVQGDMAVKILPNTTGNYKYGIAEVQLELGSTATDFEHRSYGEELALCQRYYREMAIHIGCLPWASTNGTWGGESRTFDPEMRTAPTVVQLTTPTYSTSITTVPAGNTGSGSSVNVNYSSAPDRVLIQNNASGGTLFAVKTNNSYDAEL
jgi:hypothetical protein